MYVYLFHSWLFFLPNGVDLAVVPQSLVPKIAYEGLQALDSMAFYLACLNNRMIWIHFRMRLEVMASSRITHMPG